MKRIVIALCLLACSKKTEENTPTAQSSASQAPAPAVTKPALANACPESFDNELPKCNGALVNKLDKYTWKVPAAGTYDVSLTQTDKARGFRPVLIVWKDPDETISQDDQHDFGVKAHVSVTLQPGTYHVSVINGSKTNEVLPALPYELEVSRAK